MSYLELQDLSQTAADSIESISPDVGTVAVKLFEEDLDGECPHLECEGH